MAAVSVLVVLLVSLLIARVGTVALTVTGMSREAARFQARSAFFGVGFTTGEAEAEERRARLEACRLARHPRHGQRDSPPPGRSAGDEQDDEDADRRHGPRGYPEVR